jgi:exodeoxyribonuclease VII large subunit
VDIASWELIQKDEFSNTPVAKASAKCWNNSWMMIRPNFERVTGQRLHPGMKVLLRVQASFHEAYGFSWIITDIDPTFTWVIWRGNDRRLSKD